MKYEAKAYHSVNQTVDADGCNEEACTTANWGLADHYPKSSSTGLPWRRINITNASTECNSLNAVNAVSNKYDLISNSEWMTIARNTEIQDINWDSGVSGSGAMFRGHSDDAPSDRLEASADNDPYFGTENTDLELMGSGKEQKRTLSLSNGGVIWDFSGNLWEFVDWSMDTGLQQGPKTCLSSWIELQDVSCTDLSEAHLMPFIMNLTSINGVGQFRGGTGTGGATLRGGGWYDGPGAGVYALYLFYGVTRQDLYSGFRCVYRP
jgi:formylglycine-generating enzyme required for sulfatase activity